MHRKPVKRIFTLSIFLIVPLLTFTLTFLFNATNRQNHQTYIAEIEATTLISKKDFLRDAVERTIFDIEHERSLCLQDNRLSVGNTVEEKASCDEINVREIIKNKIRNTRLRDQGYIWINEIKNMDGGKDYAIRLVHPNLPETEGMSLSTEMTDIKGNTPYLTELEGVKKNGEVFFEYWFKKLNSEKIEHKLTFAKLYEPYNWVVATGVYLDEFKSLVEKRVAAAEQQMRQQNMKVFILAAVAAMVAFLLSLMFNRRLDSILDFYANKIAEREDSLQRMNEQLEATVAERTKQALETERYYRLLYDNAPISLWLEDFSWTRNVIQDLKSQGIDNFREYFEANPDVISECAQNIRVLDVNLASVELHNAGSKEDLLDSIHKTFTEESFLVFKEELVALANGKTRFSADAVVKTLDGKRINVHLCLFIEPSDVNWSRVYVALLDIQDRKRYEDELKNNHHTLEEQVRKRTSELEKVVKLMTGREVRMSELKKEIQELRDQLKDK